MRIPQNPKYFIALKERSFILIAKDRSPPSFSCFSNSAISSLSAADPPAYAAKKR